MSVLIKWAVLLPVILCKRLRLWRKLYIKKLYDAHIVHETANETPLIYVDRHLLHEVTSPQAFDGLRAHNRLVRQPNKTFATMDHNVSTQTKDINASGEMARIQMQTLIKNCQQFAITLYDLKHPFKVLSMLWDQNKASLYPA